MEKEYIPPNLVEFAQNSQKLIPSHKRMTARLLNLHGDKMFNLIARLFAEAETAKSNELNRIVATLLPYFFIKSDNALDIKLEEEHPKVLPNPQQLPTDSLERIVAVMREEFAKLSK